MRWLATQARDAETPVTESSLPSHSGDRYGKKSAKSVRALRWNDDHGISRKSDGVSESFNVQRYRAEQSVLREADVACYRRANLRRLSILVQ